MATLVFWFEFTAGKVGKTGLAPSVYIRPFNRATGAFATAITGTATEADAANMEGLYYHREPNLDPSVYDYPAHAETADATVNFQHVKGLWTRFAEGATVVNWGSWATDGTLNAHTLAAGASQAGAAVDLSGAAAARFSVECDPPDGAHGSLVLVLRSDADGTNYETSGAAKRRWPIVVPTDGTVIRESFAVKAEDLDRVTPVLVNASDKALVVTLRSRRGS